MEFAIDARDLSKTYRIHQKAQGLKNSLIDLFHREYLEKLAVNELSFQVPKGQILGLLGENGSGKTTTLKMLTGILYPTRGIVQVLGYNPSKRKKDFLKKICFVMGNKSEVNWDLPAIDSFQYQKLIYEVPDELYKKNLSYFTEILGIAHLLNTPLRRLSLGERMKMELVNNFLYSPEVAFLDEPTIGLDLQSQIAIRTFIKEYAEKNQATVIITSHYMDDIEETCDRVLLLNKGTMCLFEDVENLKKTDTAFKNVILEFMKKADSEK
jgi:ABC-2 type transport system ATP-binding protein